MALEYHAGQIEVQEEANTRKVADTLASWVGPVGEFVSVADLILLATANVSGDLSFAAVSGKPPLVEAAGRARLRLPGLRLAEPGATLPAGGIAINFAQLRRARLNGSVTADGDGSFLTASEAFTNCRKYIAPSIALGGERRIGPLSGATIAFDDPWLQTVVSAAETAFLASVSPTGQPDVSHRGGPPGFLQIDPAAAMLTWPEYVGDGMLKSAGNVRTTARLTLLVVDLVSGDAAELSGEGAYRTLRTARKARTAALERHREEFPVQGEMTVRLMRATRLHVLFTPRQRFERHVRVTSYSPLDEQAPQ